MWTYPFMSALSRFNEDASKFFEAPFGPHDEVEARMGVFSAGKFKPGVDRETMSTIISKLDEFSGWHDSTEWAETTDMFLGDVRMTVSYNDTDYSIERSACCKSLVAPPLNLLTDSTYDLRVSQKKETPVVIEEELPAVFRPTHVRIKQRKSYVYRPNDWTDGVWRYDLTMVWEGVTKTEAEKWQRSATPPIYEVEIEYIGGEAYRQTKEPVKLATNMLMKCADLLTNVTHASIV